MAALSAAGSLTRRLYGFRVSFAAIRCVATNSKVSDNYEQNTTEDGEKSTKRDPLAVLKVLASTVQPTALAPSRELYEDVGLYPKSPRKREECKVARMSGLKAADFILHKYPQLFPMRKAEPGWSDMNQAGAVETEQDLKDIIAEMKPQEAITGYEKLLKDGVSVSLQTRNELLDLVGYYGTVSATEGVDTGKSDSSEGESSSSESSDESATSDEEEVENVRHKRTWSMNNYAEKLFKTMEDKNSRSYDAMILALLKHNYHDRAFELFEDMREQNFQASIFTYNGLINKSYVYYGYGEKLWTAVMNLIEHIKQEPAVLPDLNTYNELLKLCALIPNGSDKALEVFRDMCNKGIEPSLATFSRLLRAEYYRDRSMMLYENDEGDLKHKQSTNNSLLQAVISHLESFDKLPGLKHSSDIKFFNTAMGSALFCQDANAAHRLYALAETNDKTLLGQKRGLFYATFLVTLAQSERSAEIVYHMYKELVPAKLIPQSWVYSELFRMVEREKMPRLVPKLYQDMKRYRVPINEQTCRGIFSALARRTAPKNHRQYVEIMTDVFFWMKKFNIPISPYMIGQLVRQYCAGGHLKQAWKAMEMFDEHDFHPTYVALMQLLDCCSMNRDRDQAMKVFEILAKYGYIVSKRKQSSIFDNTQMPLSHRLYINSLFENAEELDRRRAKYNRPKMQEVSENEEVENS